MRVWGGEVSTLLTCNSLSGLERMKNQVNAWSFVSKGKEQVKIVREDDNGQKDVIHCGNPVELITTLLKKLGGAASVNQLCQVTDDGNVDY